MNYKYKVVGISCCPTGIAHTYMSAEAIERECRAYGIYAHFEKQGQLGIEDEISEKEFKDADAIILCCGISPEGEDRFEDYKAKTVSVDYSVAVGKPEIAIEALKKAGLISKELKKINK